MRLVRVIVTGSQHWPYPALVDRHLDQVLTDAALGEGDKLVIIHGDCKSGADRFARRWVERRRDAWIAAGRRGPEIDQVPYPANWELHGNSAGMIRNKVMVEAETDADFALGFRLNLSPGTTNCLRLIAAAGIPSLVRDAYLQDAAARRQTQQRRRAHARTGQEALFA